MSRDVLLACLVLALLLNLAILGQVVNMYRRQGRGSQRGRLDARDATAVMTARPSPVARNGAGNGTDEPESASAALPAPAASTNPEPRPVVAEPSNEPLSTIDVVAQRAEPSTNGGPPAPGEPVSAARSGRTTRGRRFVLPPLDEDYARSEAAIEAFIGGPSPGTAAERPHRRRHRVRRPAGAPVQRTSMLVWLQGFGDLDRVVGTPRAGSVAAAFLEALRKSARATDEVREMSAGRVRVVVDADDAGATAFVERARGHVEPWLELLVVPLRLETGGRESTHVVPMAGARRAIGDR